MIAEPAAVAAIESGGTAGEAADLSFRARVTATGAGIRVEVDVTDDHVVWDGARADHVEVQLADAGLVADAERARQGVDEQRRAVEEALAGGPREPGLIEAVKIGIGDAIDRSRADERVLVAAVVSSPQAPAAAPASSVYTVTPRGYRAVLTIPLAGVLPATSGAVTAIRYRIVVGDVDHAATAEDIRTAVLPAGSDESPISFAHLRLPRTWRPHLNARARIARQLSPGGRFELRGGAYVYVLPIYDSRDWDFDGSCCTPNISWPRRFEPLQPPDVSRLPGTQLYVGPDAVLFVAGGRRIRIELAEAEPLAQARRRGRYYLVFLDNEPSRPGSPMSQCGAGTEVSVLWIELSAGLIEQKRDSVLIGSCWHSLEYDHDAYANGVSGETDLLDPSTGEPSAHVAYRYDQRRPQRGLVITPKPAP
ncbi:MAG: hypothetical protein ABI629_26015 [bacterium]